MMNLGDIVFEINFNDKLSFTLYLILPSFLQTHMHLYDKTKPFGQTC